MKKTSYVMAACLALVVASSARAASAWPVLSSVTVSQSLQATLPPSGRVFEPSDVAILGSGIVLVSDEGDVAVMNDDGSGLSQWLLALGADLEGVAVSGTTLYALNERDRDVYVYDVTTRERLATHDLSPWIAGSDNLGPEGLAISGTTLYVGHQATGVIYEFDVAGGTPVLSTSWSTGISVGALSMADDGKLYVMGSGVLRAYAPDRSYAEYALSSQPQPEGVALRVNCAAGTASLFIANDTGPVYRYDGFPVSCPAVAPEPVPEPEPEPELPPAPVDADADGVTVDLDCNDADAAVSSPITYFRDADADTLGSASVTTSACASSAPSGYVTNATDANDAQAYFSAVGTTNGSIVVTYGNGSSKTYQVFSLKTSKVISKLYQYKEGPYLIVYSPSRSTVAVVNPYVGSVVALRATPSRQRTLDAWLVSVIGY